VEEGGITADECDAFLDYAATFLSNIGNYYVSLWAMESTPTALKRGVGLWRSEIRPPN
jgi:hypothetical protein